MWMDGNSRSVAGNGHWLRLQQEGGIFRAAKWVPRTRQITKKNPYRTCAESNIWQRISCTHGSIRMLAHFPPHSLSHLSSWIHDCFLFHQMCRHTRTVSLLFVPKRRRSVVARHSIECCLFRIEIAIIPPNLYTLQVDPVHAYRPSSILPIISILSTNIINITDNWHAVIIYRNVTRLIVRYLQWCWMPLRRRLHNLHLLRRNCSQYIPMQPRSSVCTLLFYVDGGRCGPRWGH